HRVGGWGHPLSDEGSGAWIGAEAARLALRAHDGRAAPSALAEAVLARFEGDPHRIVAWMTEAKPRDVATIAPLVVEAAAAGDAGAIGILRAAGAHVAELAERLVALGAERIALLGGLASPLDPYLPAALRPRLAAPRGSALDGALSLARTLAPDHPGAPMR
ncbi:MAG TPA: BadF/BadG/BcrA/BcrD ATPase family protein, partial [Salinarimonas sp.]|nr:BadF/BadG/BcrA/BcrD ATPase family protein [Salinarimonas sp.]